MCTEILSAKIKILKSELIKMVVNVVGSKWLGGHGSEMRVLR